MTTLRSLQTGNRIQGVNGYMGLWGLEYIGVCRDLGLKV